MISPERLIGFIETLDAKTDCPQSVFAGLKEDGDTTMHEMSLISKVVEMVLEECAKLDAIKVRSVNLGIGEAYDVVEEFVPGLFAHLTRGTIAEEAKVVVKRIPLTVICNKCGFVFPLDVHDSKTQECHQCQAYKDYRLYSGREFFIESIEIEASSLSAETNFHASP